MLRKAELKHLRLQKKLLVLQSDANRLVLMSEWRRLRSLETWMNAAGDAARRHPVWTTALATATGALTVNALRKPGALAGGLKVIRKIAIVSFAGWNFFKGKKPAD
jgi:hypothetical protein